MPPKPLQNWLPSCSAQAGTQHRHTQVLAKTRSSANSYCCHRVVGMRGVRDSTLSKHNQPEHTCIMSKNLSGSCLKTSLKPLYDIENLFW